MIIIKRLRKWRIVSSLPTGRVHSVELLGSEFITTVIITITIIIIIMIIILCLGRTGRGSCDTYRCSVDSCSVGKWMLDSEGSTTSPVWL